MDTAQRPAPALRPDRDVYTVSRLNREVRVLLERGFGTLWLEAEISNLARPSSGHWYFSLKDAGAQVRCAMFRQRNSLCSFAARDGQKVLVRARIGLYEPRGEYQLIVEYMEDAGLGALRRQFEELRARLAAEGLFAPDRKQALPSLPKRIGIITSPTAAAEGVGARTSAAKSAIVKSTSCPIPEMIGIGQATMARAKPSSLKAHRSSSEPPPRARIKTSHSARRPASPIAAMISLAACAPWTGTG